MADTTIFCKVCNKPADQRFDHDKCAAAPPVLDNSILDKKYKKPRGSGKTTGTRNRYTSNPPGSPGRIPIDPLGVRRLAAKFWSPAEIGAFYGVSRTTIVNTYSNEIAEGRQDGRACLRDLQWKAAQEGSEKVLIHMSQQHLQEHPHSSLSVEQLPAERLVKAIEAKLLEDAEARQLLGAPAEEDEEDGGEKVVLTPSTEDPKGT